MPENFDNLEDQEKLRAENEFLKLKLMLEKGAQFGVTEEGKQIPPQIENDFLKYIAEFERQWENQKLITVFDKIGKPGCFQPAASIADADIEAAWKALQGHLNKYGVDLDVCSPNVSTRELYRFTIEELFLHQIEDLDMPGMMNCFIYDEFHPDPVYDNARLVQEDLLADIFRKEPLFCEIHYARNGFTFNGQYYPDYKKYFEKLNRFKSLFDEIELLSTNVNSCVVDQRGCTVSGSYKARAKDSSNALDYTGKFVVKLEMGDFKYWDFVNILIDGFDPG